MLCLFYTEGNDDAVFAISIYNGVLTTTNMSLDMSSYVLVIEAVDSGSTTLTGTTTLTVSVCEQENCGQTEHSKGGTARIVSDLCNVLIVTLASAIIAIT